MGKKRERIGTFEIWRFGGEIERVGGGKRASELGKEKERASWGRKGAPDAAAANHCPAKSSGW